MNMERIMKGLALIAILGGIARIGMAPCATIWGEDSIQELLFALVACILMGIGIFGIYFHEAHRIGTIGFISVLMIAISSTITTCLVWSAMLGVGTEDNDYVMPLKNINSLLALLGMIGFCVQTIRARIYPIWTVVLFLLFPVMSFIPAVTDWATAVWGLSYVGFGYYAYKNKTILNRTYFDAAA
ncbi:hypothetical protein [Cohnella silvisoli]|uniref:Uncharacterized protein n=1 Tax=Cohnella silvisoli TaxID=2873699 RepID=A0ABV1KN99_9BACL|nr:hypothetical protein [Cohnella silvisoli]MCD9020366.1 hypothetical protein [Cohnella silvisoli]